MTLRTDADGIDGFTIYLTCNGCGYEEEYVESDMHAAWQEANEEGWRAFTMSDGEYQHVCKTCWLKPDNGLSPKDAAS